MQIGFKSSIQIIFSLLLLFAIGIIAANQYFQSRSNAIAASNHLIDIAIENFLLSTRLNIDSTVGNLSLLSLALRDMDIIQQRDSIFPLLFDVMRKSNLYESIYIADASGSALMLQKSPVIETRVIDQARQTEEWSQYTNSFEMLGSTQQAISLNVLESEWYQNTLDYEEPFWSEVYGLPGQRSALYVTFPVLSQDNEKVGVVAITVDLTNLTSLLSNKILGVDSVSMMIDDNHRIIAYPEGFALLPDLADRISHTSLLYVNQIRDQRIAQGWSIARQAIPEGETSSEVLQVKIDGGRYFIKTSQVTEGFAAEWHLFFLVPSYEVTGGVTRNLYTSLLLALIIVIAGSYLIFLIAGMLTRPIYQIANNIKCINQLRFHDVKPVDSVPFYEFKQLNHVLEFMNRRLLLLNQYIAIKKLKNIIDKEQLGFQGKKETIYVLTVNFSDATTYQRRSLSIEDKEYYLRHYYPRVLEAVYYNQGAVDQMFNDHVVAFWNDYEPKQAAYQIGTSALNLIEGCEQINRFFRKHNKPPVVFCIGLDYGECLTGNYGTSDLMVNMKLGSAVDGSSWLAQYNALYGTQILVSQKMKQELEVDFCFRWVDRVIHPDTAQQTDIYELMGYINGPEINDRRDFVYEYERSLSLRYIEDKPEAALQILNRLYVLYPQDKSIHYQISTLKGEVKGIHNELG